MKSMKTFSSIRRHAQTRFVLLNTHACKACWKCIEQCPNNVIGNIDLPFHKHALILHPEECIGCSKCIDACIYDALSRNIHENYTTKKDIRPYKSMIINLFLLVIGIAIVLSGFILQSQYHMGHHGEIITTDKVWSFDYFQWSFFHKISAILFSILVIIHLLLHDKWVKTVITKKLFRRNRQILILLLLFIVTTITGFIAWFYSLLNDIMCRKICIEIHDKITLFLFLFLLLHILKRKNWFLNRFKS